MPNIEPAQPSPTGSRDDVRRLVQMVFEQWYQHRLAEWEATRIVDGPAVTFDPDACRAWLADGVADEHAINDTFSTTELTIPAGVEELLAALDDDPQPQVWRLHPALRQVQVWRTADGDGVDGGAIITADLSLDGERVRLATLHQGFDDFTADAATAGIGAAVEALGHVARLVNAELAAYRTATAAPNRYTVIGSWDNDQPTPVAVGQLPRFSASTAVIQRSGWWVVDVTANDPGEATKAALDAVRAAATQLTSRRPGRSAAEPRQARTTSVPASLHSAVSRPTGTTLRAQPEARTRAPASGGDVLMCNADQLGDPPDWDW